jgi:hypothetical protein
MGKFLCESGISEEKFRVLYLLFLKNKFSNFNKFTKYNLLSIICEKMQPIKILASFCVGVGPHIYGAGSTLKKNGQRNPSQAKRTRIRSIRVGRRINYLKYCKIKQDIKFHTSGKMKRRGGREEGRVRGVRKGCEIYHYYKRQFGNSSDFLGAIEISNFCEFCENPCGSAQDNSLQW